MEDGDDYSVAFSTGGMYIKDLAVLETENRIL
jgi:hypothetical protein